MKTRKLNLLAGAAVGVMGLTVAGQAMAADEVHWEWNKQIVELIGKALLITGDYVPSGMLELQDLQMQIGDVTATSTVTNVTYTPPAGSGVGSQTVTINGRFSDDNEAQSTFASDPNGPGDPELFDNGNDNNVAGSVSVDYVEGPASSASLAMKDLDDPNANGTFNQYVITLTVEPGQIGAPLDAVTQLPEVESIATAVGNNVAVDSDVMVEMHNSQFAFGDFGAPNDTDGATVLDVLGEYYKPQNGSEVDIDGDATDGVPVLTDVDYTDSGFSGNIGVAGTIALLVAGSDDVITQGNVTATSTVGGGGDLGIDQASVVSNATAVVNNKSVTIDPVTADDAIFIGDVTQFAYMNASATSTVDNVSISGFQNVGLGTGGNSVIGRPIVSSVATAVGNNLSVTIDRGINAQ
jgi:hypothetical protein